MKFTDKRHSAKFIPDAVIADNPELTDVYQADDLNTKDAINAEDHILRDAVNNIGRWFDYWRLNNENFRTDLFFLFVDQWESNDRVARDLNKKPCLMFNYLHAIVMQLLGEQRQNSPSVLVRATKAGVPQEEVSLREDLIRQKFYENKADIIFQTGFMYALAGGYGAWIVEVDWANPETFDQDIFIREIQDPATTFFDPLAKNSDKSDGKYCGYFTTMTKEEFKIQFPNAKSDLSFQVGSGYNFDYKIHWMDGKKVRIADYWIKEEYEETIVQLSTGESMTLEQAEEMLDEEKSLISELKKHAKMGKIVPYELLHKTTIANQRRSVCHKIRHYKMIMDEILEVTEWPCDHFPLIFLDCQSIMLDGRQITRSFHRFAQDAQRYINYLGSEAAEAMLNSHHGNWIASDENVTGKYMEMWQHPQRSKGVFIAKRDAAGQLPQYIPAPQISQSFDTQFQRAVGDIQNILGRFEANRGQQGNEQSGVAINARANLGNLASFVPFDNLKRAIEQTARVVLGLFPCIFDTTRPIISRSKDNKEKRVVLNQPVPGGYKNDMSLKGFEVTIEAGASFAMQKQAALQALQVAMQINPQYAPALYDLYAENLDLDNMPQLVDRIRDLQLGIPLPQIIAKETGKKAPPQPPNPMMMEQQQKAQEAQQDFSLRQKQQQLDQNDQQLKAQQMVQDAIDSHAKNILETQKFNRQFQTEIMKQAGENARAGVGHHVDLVKHFNPSQKSTSTNP